MLRRTPAKRMRSLGAIAVIATPLLLTVVPADAVVGAPTVANAHAFTARIDIGAGERVCSGALVDPQWVVTAGSCFVDDPASGSTPPAGPPVKPTKITVGRTDLTTTTGLVTTVTELVPYQGRDLVMARLAQPATGITPVALSLAPPNTGDTVKAVGFGRTQTDWSPLKQHTGTFTVDSVADDALAITGQDDNAICAGDTGGPLISDSNGKVELIAVNSRSWQGGCWGTNEEETRTGAVSARVDDLNAWIQQVRALPQQAQVIDGDFDGDGKSDVAALYDYGRDAQGRAQSSLWVFKSDGTTFRAPRVAWDSGATSWTWASSKLTSGDFDGDGKTDIGVLYNIGLADGKYRSRLWTFTSTGTTFNPPTVAWDSGTTSWNWDRSKLTSGDYNGDGKTDIGVLYNIGLIDGKYRSRLWTFTSTGTTFNPPTVAWDSGTTSWNWDRSKLTSGDYNGDGKTDIAVLYDYDQTPEGTNHSKLWWAFTSTGATFNPPTVAWDSGAMSWNWDASKVTSGDYNGDGKTDVGVLYNYGLVDGKYRSKLWTFTSTGTTLQAPKTIWDSDPISWNWNASQPLSGDTTGDGKTDMAIFYDYGTASDGRTRQALWNLISSGDTMTAPHKDWDSAIQ
ncbi:FG-GAP-like repeat-containing protein [Streptomyces sp. I4(2020)]|uniref:FG-GAP-like repeat-containing protein n=1 Tax=Streptomyces sp. I4(2020) TaxID=2760981 RepID=UPI0018EE72A1|nr:FG-GAP-like repeat-containing protein [Streptomyces sp. I4(2020)]MBJ6628829.1 VCBS repeat-containing protein [Streptomyces sp. I4(2020)]